jgi:Putative Ig domain
MFRFGAGQATTGNKSAFRVAAISLLTLATLITAACGGTGEGPFAKNSVLHRKSLLDQNAGVSRITLPGSLPDAILDAPYSAVLQPSGSVAPYRFLLLGGEMPDGLSMDSSSGRVFGRPLEAGDFDLLIRVASHGDRAQGIGHVKIQVAKGKPSLAVEVHISPITASLSSGSSMQFQASVAHATNTAVNWSATAGSISGTGLFIAPQVSANTNVTVTATSVQDPSKSASATVTVTATAATSPLVLTTTSLPSATVGTNYSAQLIATGGVAPYSWRIVTGGLPPGILIDASSGALTGSASTTGSFTFSAQVTDSTSQASQQQLTLTVQANTVNNTCGPPTYNCARTDLNVVPVPSAVPNVGNLVGNGVVITDPDFGNRIARITDANSNPIHLNGTYSGGLGGSADVNVWNTDSSLLVVQDTKGWLYPLAFNASSMQAGRMYAPSFPQTGGIRMASGGSWSRTDPNVLYTFESNTPVISRYDFTDRVNPPTPTTVVDFSTAANCLPAGFRPTWKSPAGVSGADSMFAVSYSNAGPQGTGVYIVAYKPGNGCAVYNTQTGQVYGNWGSQGTINIADRFTIHNTKLSKDGNWIVIIPTTCFSAACKASYFWQIGTTNVIACPSSCSGHWTEGNFSWMNNDQTPKIGQYKVRAFSDPETIKTVIANVPTLQIPFDQHPSWNNVDSNDAYPFLSSTFGPNWSTWGTWYNEVIAISPTTGLVSRFAHTFATTKSHIFSTQYAIGSVSQDGRFFVFSSDWMGTLGSESGAPTCTIGTDCRGDAFVVELR